MRCIDTRHRRAGAYHRIQRHDTKLRVLCGKTVHQVDLRGNSDHGPGIGFVDGPDDGVCGSDLVGELDNLMSALGVHEDEAVGILGTECRNMLGPEALVDRAVSLPQDQGGLL